MKIYFDADDLKISELQWLKKEHDIDLKDFQDSPSINLIWGIVCLDHHRRGLPSPNPDDIKFSDIEIEGASPLVQSNESDGQMTEPQWQPSVTSSNYIPTNIGSSH